MKEQHNKDIKKLMKKMKISQFDLSLKLGVSETTIFRMLRKELTAEERERIINAILEIGEVV